MFNNYTSNYDNFIKEENKTKIEEFLENNTIKIYEGLYKKVIKENKSLEDLETKIDVIMDALGLKNDDDNEEEKESNDEIQIEDVNVEDVDIDETEEKKEDNPLDNINFVD